MNKKQIMEVESEENWGKEDEHWKIDLMKDKIKSCKTHIH